MCPPSSLGGRTLTYWTFICSYWRHKIGRREQAHSRAASGLMHARQPKGGSLSSWNQIGEGAPPCFIATRKLSHARWKLTRKGGILTCSSQRRNQHNTTIHQRWDFQTPVVLKIKATRASVKLCGATSTWVRLSHRFRIYKYTSQHKWKGVLRT